MLLRRLLDGERITHDGRFYRFADALSAPRPIQDHLPILIGGSGEKVTLRIVAQHAHIWHSFGDPEEAGRLSRVLDDWCRRVGRNPQEIERSILLDPEQIPEADRYVEQGITHLMVHSDGPDYDLSDLEQMVRWRDSRQR
jgi:alkanesulfonate monooxygenase SsuD/methylene tetrahydromethanopterin reductase-like flavin-dependent oxidoreductase (luciferase family)